MSDVMVKRLHSVFTVERIRLTMTSIPEQSIGEETSCDHDQYPWIRTIWRLTVHLIDVSNNDKSMASSAKRSTLIVGRNCKHRPPFSDHKSSKNLQPHPWFRLSQQLEWMLQSLTFQRRHDVTCNCYTKNRNIWCISVYLSCSYHNIIFTFSFKLWYVGVKSRKSNEWKSVRK